MRKLMWVLVGVMIVVTLFSEVVNAAEWGSDKSIMRFTDEDFQLRQCIGACKITNKNDMEAAKRCAKSNYASYLDIRNTMKDMGEMAQQNPGLKQNEVFNVMLSCLMDEIERYWMPQFNTAPWTKVRNNSLQCMQEAKDRMEQ